MKFALTIESDNEDNGPDMVAFELARVAELISEGGWTSGTLRDRNGNAVGKWEMSES